ncbi:DsbA family protein [Acidisoma cellulosilytica]|uniref:DsbA family protein n=1 Tax=Acidisoma cellulosilyticum TaxID=2802395 RepID=A0A963Z1Q7_9PROT|nr:DsbA family protein [Acidisoma cellulosilyticum]MCB8880392.1 DsbA family protein [Acidisoma cellulosilyticum]
MSYRSVFAAAGLVLASASWAGPVFAQQSTSAADGSALSPAQRAAVIGLIRQELVEDPSILRAAIGALQAQDQQSQAAVQGKAIAAAQADLVHNAADPSIGSPRAPITVVEFYDTRCPYCRVMRPEFSALVKQDPNVRVVFKDIPILGQNSVTEARALLAAQRQGGYEKMQAALMTQQAAPTEAHLRSLATQLGLNGDQLIRDMDDPAIGQRLAANTTLAQQLGITGTPGIIVGTQLVPGAISLDDLQKLVAAQAG